MVITSANADHLAMVLRAAQAGVAVLVEKPIATTLADARAIVDAFARANLTLATAFPCPFSPAFDALQQRCTPATWASVLAAKTTNRGSMPGGFFIQLERSGGGAVIDHTVHVADLLRRLTHSDATRVYAEIGHGLYHQTWDDCGLPDHRVRQRHVCHAGLQLEPPQELSHLGRCHAQSGGRARQRDSRPVSVNALNLYPASATRATWLPWGSDLDELMVADFVTSVRDKRSPRSTGEDGLAALEVALAAYESARTGQPVDIAT